MTPWQWWATEADIVDCGEWELGEFDTRDEAVAEANRAYPKGTPFFVIEASLFAGQWDECWSELDGHCDDEPDVYRLGKKRAGRLLDGVQHDGFPA